jgi:hypothetical protein
MAENAISGKKRVAGEGNFEKKIGLFVGRVIAINPNVEEYKEILGIDLPEDSKETEYLGETKESNTYLRVTVWLEEDKTKQKFKVNFFLEDKPRENKDGTKKQYKNSIGMCSWADDPNNLPSWFKERDYRVAYTGEEELYSFLKMWFGKLDLRDKDSILQLDWKKLMRGNVRDLTIHIDGELTTPVLCLATVVIRDKDGESKEYQGVYNKAFLPASNLSHFRVVDYSNPEIISNLAKKKSNSLKFHEKFVLQVTNPEHGC